MSGHTPGPWIADEYEHTERGTAIIAVHNPNKIEQPTRGMVAWVSEGLGANYTLEHTTANARLIAAAPDLLEACHAVCMVMAFEPRETLPKAIGAAYDKCRAAIAKAEGQL